ncbi:response regulator transcription factor [candidate division KSB1 bacterium]|nr:response regulator transcription factor [candidate division KSB1 bacterium]
MEKTKILLASRPRMLSEVIRHLIELQPDMVVVNEVSDPLEIFRIIAISGADVVIVTPLGGNGVPHICSHLLAAYPLLIIVTHSAKGEAAYLYQVGVPKKRINEPSAQSIVDAVREAVQLIKRSHI